MTDTILWNQEHFYIEIYLRVADSYYSLLFIICYKGGIFCTDEISKGKIYTIMKFKQSYNSTFKSQNTITSTMLTLLCISKYCKHFDTFTIVDTSLQRTPHCSGHIFFEQMMYAIKSFYCNHVFKNILSQLFTKHHKRCFKSCEWNLI